MTSRAASVREPGFTLLEVMAGVLVLGLLYTVLASAAMRGLRSEGTDRRRADAAMVADRQLAALETEIEAGAPFADGRSEQEQEPFKILIEVAPADMLTLLPPALGRELKSAQDPRAPSVLHDERGQSRIRRVSVIVEWDEAGEPERVERTTYAYDKAAIAQYFPATGENAPADDSESNRISQPSLLTSSRDRRAASSGFPFVSRAISSIMRPLRPPAELNLSISIMQPLRDDDPTMAARPDWIVGMPILIGLFCARETKGKPTTAVAATAAPVLMKSRLWRRVSLPLDMVSSTRFCAPRLFCRCVYLYGQEFQVAGCFGQAMA